MAKTPDQTDGQEAPIEETALFVSPDTATDGFEDNEEKLAWEISKRIQAAYDSVGLVGKGEYYRKQTLPDGRRERTTVLRARHTETVNYDLTTKGGSLLAGSFSLEYSPSDDFVDTGSVTYHREDDAVMGQEALELIDREFQSIFPNRVRPASEQSPTDA